MNDPVQIPETVSVDAVRAGNRRALARAITLIESSRPEHRRAAEPLLAALLPHAGGALRLGISGVPGVGKSTFIEALGLEAVRAGRKVAVLAIDPSSPLTGGSILGDKTRMERLSRNENAFVRPSPSKGALGGVARRTRETMLACEAAGFDLAIVETVGVGQSETAVADMVDIFLLLLAPGAGDELQGIKKGIVEMADLLVVNKADGDLKPAAERARRDYASALHMLSPLSKVGKARVMTCSALEEKGIDEVWRAIVALYDERNASGALAQRRAEQARAWMWTEVSDTVMERVRAHPALKGRLAALERDVAEGRVTPAEGARRILDAIEGKAG